MRLRWLDLLRSTAILGMIVYHAAYDLQIYHSWDLHVTTGIWKVFQVAIASLFLVVSGISAGFWTRSEHALWKGWKRGWTILSAAMLVSLATAVADEATWVRFGILHLIALSAFLLPLLRRLQPALLAVLGIACILIGLFAIDVRANTNLFIPLGFWPNYFRSVDYTPIFPWIGPVLIGFSMGISISKRPPSGRRGRDRPLLACLCWPGRHSLAIYLLHQPVILSILWIVERT